MTEKLVSAQELGNMLNITRETVRKALNDGRIEKPKYTIGHYQGWTTEQAERIKRGFVRREW